MNEDRKLAIERACEKLSKQYGNRIDTGDYQGFADLFTDDAVLELGPARMEGRDAILRMAESRGDDEVTVHVFSNIVIDVEDEGNAGGHTNMIFYKGTKKDGKPIMPMPAPATVGHYEDRFVRTGEGWRIAHRKAVVRFLDPSQF